MHFLRSLPEILTSDQVYSALSAARLSTTWEK